LEIVRDYLSIQQLRFPDVFTYTVGVPQEIARSPIVKLTIQPLVENAIYHGLTPAARRGRLSVSAVCVSEIVRITVSDDGVGFPRDWMANWPTRMQSADKPTAGYEADLANSVTPHFGLRNVHDRIQLHFGTRYGLHIESGRGQATRVTVNLPLCLEVESSA
jgi:two-component system sensor histidine kinase YesM